MRRLYTSLKRRDPLTASTYKRQRELQAAVAISACKHTKLLVWDGGWKQIPLLLEFINLLNKFISSGRCVQIDCTVCDGSCKQSYKQRVVHIDQLLLNRIHCRCRQSSCGRDSSAPPSCNYSRRFARRLLVRNSDFFRLSTICSMIRNSMHYQQFSLNILQIVKNLP